MLQKTPTAADLAEMPTCRKLAQARSRLEEARQASEAARAEFNEHCRRIVARGSMLLDAEATKAESEAIRTAAAARLAGAEVEKLKQAHGVVLSKHFARYENECLQLVLDALRDARNAADQIVSAVNAAERDGLAPSYRMGKVRRALRHINETLELLK